jgi:hypothetical protein
MPQAISPNRLQPSTPYADNIAYINDNFDKMVAAVNDLGMKRYGTGTYLVQTLAAGASIPYILNIVDTKNQYTLDEIAVLARWQIFVDNNNNYSYLLPGGSSVYGTGLDDASFGWWQTRVVPTGSPTDTKAVIYAILKNNDSVSHDYYVSIDAYFGNSPISGILR